MPGCMTKCTADPSAGCYPDIFAALCRRSGCGKSCMILLWVRVPAYGHADWRGLIGIIGLAAVEQTLQGGEMMFAAGLALVGRRGGVLAQSVLYDRGRHALELAARPHRVELHL